MVTQWMRMAHGYTLEVTNRNIAAIPSCDYYCLNQQVNR
jgi:hypothetical protein